MRIAVVGAGLCGLSAAWHLLEQNHEVILFDSKGAGGGASGIAAGLLHPYVGEEGKRCLYATEGIAASNQLIAMVEKELGCSVANREGIVRYIATQQQEDLFLSHCRTFGDVQRVSEQAFLITSGLTIDCPLYLEGLLQCILKKGGTLILEEIRRLPKDFDQVILAAGAGMAQFAECKDLPFSLIKGQLLHCKASLPKRSMIGKGYLALSAKAGHCEVGSTYERGKSDATPDLLEAKRLIFPKIQSFFPEIEALEIVQCRAGVRVTRKGHYFPLVRHVQPGVWAFTAMGSRGLLYHAFLGKYLAEGFQLTTQKFTLFV